MITLDVFGGFMGERIKGTSMDGWMDGWKHADDGWKYKWMNRIAGWMSGWVFGFT